jgi:hypothetical protein
MRWPRFRIRDVRVEPGSGARAPGTRKGLRRRGRGGTEVQEVRPPPEGHERPEGQERPEGDGHAARPTPHPDREPERQGRAGEEGDREGREHRRPERGAHEERELRVAEAHAVRPDGPEESDPAPGGGRGQDRDPPAARVGEGGRAQRDPRRRQDHGVRDEAVLEVDRHHRHQREHQDEGGRPPPGGAERRDRRAGERSAGGLEERIPEGAARAAGPAPAAAGRPGEQGEELRGPDRPRAAPAARAADGLPPGPALGEDGGRRAREDPEPDGRRDPSAHRRLGAGLVARLAMTRR